MMYSLKIRNSEHRSLTLFKVPEQIDTDPNPSSASIVKSDALFCAAPLLQEMSIGIIGCLGLLIVCITCWAVSWNSGHIHWSLVNHQQYIYMLFFYKTNIWLTLTQSTIKSSYIYKLSLKKFYQFLNSS